MLFYTPDDCLHIKLESCVIRVSLFESNWLSTLDSHIKILI